MHQFLLVTFVLLLACGTRCLAAGDAPFAIPTFHCLGLYWSPPGGMAGKDVLVRYRRQGVAEWKEALPMRYNPIPKTDEELTDYRGSIVHLQPAATYEVPLTLAGTTTTATLNATTWSEKFPVDETVPVGNRATRPVPASTRRRGRDASNSLPTVPAPARASPSRTSAPATPAKPPTSAPTNAACLPFSTACGRANIDRLHHEPSMHDHYQATLEKL